MRCARCHQVLEHSTWGEATGHVLVDVRPCGCPRMESKAQEAARVDAALADQAALPTVEGLAEAMAEVIATAAPYKASIPMEIWCHPKPEEGALAQFAMEAKPCAGCGLLPWESPATRKCKCGRLVIRL